MSAIRILLILNEAQLAGTERHVLLLAENINKQKYSVEVVLFSDGPIVSIFKDLGIVTHVLSRKNRYDVLIALKLYKLIKTKVYKIVHSHSGHFGCFIAKAARVPIIISTHHGLGYTREQLHPMGLFVRLYNKLRWSLVTKSVTVSSADKDILVNKINIASAKVTTIYNGLDLDAIKKVYLTKGELAERYNINTGNLVVGTIARLTSQKGIEYLIRAAKTVVNIYPNITFMVVGEGDKRESLEKECAYLGLKERFIFTGYQAHATDFMQLFDIFVLPSLWEGLPYTILEAMVHKLPVITTNVCGNPEAVMHNESGTIVEPKDSAGIAQGIITLLEDEKQREEMGAKAYERVTSLFRVENMVEQIENLYDEQVSHYYSIT